MENPIKMDDKWGTPISGNYLFISVNYNDPTAI